MSARHVHLGCLFVGLALATVLPSRAAAQDAASPPVRTITLDQAVQLAFAHNQTLRSQRLGIQASKADEITAGLKPNPTIGVVTEDLPILHPHGFSSLDYMNDHAVVTPSLSYLFERGGKREKRLTVAQDTTLMTSQNVFDAERQIRFNVDQAYVSVLLAKSSLEFAQQSLSDFDQVVTLNQQRMQAGDISQADYLKITIQKLQFEQDVSSAQVSLEQSRAALRQLLGYESVTDDYQVSGDLAHLPHPLSLDALKQEALADRPDYLAARTNLKVAQDTHALELANRARDVTGELEYQHNQDVSGFGFGVTIDLPIHDRNQGNIAHAAIGIQQAQATEAAARNAVLTDVVSAYAALQTNDHVASLYESGYLQQARDSLDISRYAYSRGATDLLDLLDAERTYQQTELAYRQVLAAYMTSAAQINFVVGKQVIP
ncbi:MAG TPA: TolC family protein [Vicinamibacterales bacterium]|jgi:cobalt-zinc-cadmium efflux system outer membrane protein